MDWTMDRKYIYVEVHLDFVYISGTFLITLGRLIRSSSVVLTRQMNVKTLEQIH